MPILYDLAAILIVVIAVVKAYRSGFLSTIIRLIGIFVIIAIAISLARIGSSFLFTALVEDPVRDYLTTNAEAITDTEALATAVSQALNELSPPVRKMLGIDKLETDAFLDDLGDAMDQSFSSGVDFLTTHVLRPPIEGILTLAIFLIVFLILLVILGLIVRALRHVHWIPVVGPLNALAGGITGLIEGILMLLILAFVANLAIAFTQNSLGWLNRDIIEQTYLFRYCFTFNPLIGS